MTYDVYAMFPEGSYLVAHGNCHDHVLDTAKTVCEKMGVEPNGFFSGLRGELKLNCKTFTLKDLKVRA
jgi:hypothetical protein